MIQRIFLLLLTGFMLPAYCMQGNNPYNPAIHGQHQPRPNGVVPPVEPINRGAQADILQANECPICFEGYNNNKKLHLKFDCVQDINTGKTHDMCLQCFAKLIRNKNVANALPPGTLPDCPCQRAMGGAEQDTCIRCLQALTRNNNAILPGCQQCTDTPLFLNNAIRRGNYNWAERLHNPHAEECNINALPAATLAALGVLVNRIPASRHPYAKPAEDGSTSNSPSAAAQAILSQSFAKSFGLELVAALAVGALMSGETNRNRTKEEQASLNKRRWLYLPAFLASHLLLNKCNSQRAANSTSVIAWGAGLVIGAFGYSYFTRQRAATPEIAPKPAIAPKKDVKPAPVKRKTIV